MQEAFITFLEAQFKGLENPNSVIFEPIESKEGANGEYDANVNDIKHNCHMRQKTLANGAENFWKNFSYYYAREDDIGNGKKKALSYIAECLKDIPLLIEEETIFTEPSDFDRECAESHGCYNLSGTWNTKTFPEHKKYNHDVIRPLNTARQAIRDALFRDMKSAPTIARLFSEVSSLDAEIHAFYQKMRLENNKFNKVLQSGAAYLKTTDEKNYLDILLGSHKPLENRVANFCNTHFNSTNAEKQAQWKRGYIAKFEEAYAEDNNQRLKKQIMTSIGDRLKSKHPQTAPTKEERNVLLSLQEEVRKCESTLEAMQQVFNLRATNSRKLTKTQCFLDIVSDYLSRINSPKLKL